MTTTVPAHAPPTPPPSDDLPSGPHPLVGGHAKAGWLHRALAVLLDSALVASVAWLATGEAPSFATLPLLDGGEDPPLASATFVWTAGSLVSLAVLQAYTGMTPGKRVTGVSVVDDRTGRPIGFAGTVLRWFAHLLDAVLMIGYLRAAWHPQGRTFADSLLGTVAVLSTRPAPHPWVAWLRRQRDDRAPRLRWPPIVTSAVALVVCAAAAATSLTQSSGGAWHSSSDGTSCTSTGDFVATAMIDSAASASWESRLGIHRLATESWQVVAAWSTGLAADDGGNRPLDAADATLTVRSPDGRRYSSQTATSHDDAHGAWDDAPDLDADDDLWWTVPELLAWASVETPEDVSGWTATATLLGDDGAVVAECSAAVPAVEAWPREP
ncbi:hypothetical protein GCM10009718_15970 [Isoptericola halotolerans]|uniref:RDD family membrane protein YckC n=1 Tax=Isoptericola halotolerans TaxID=300560 RepID=A0ABX1ZXZ6_9MICO|nr:RDD family protein [Isoptericola halotolerans]NOV95483.1 putative RDD family membrane protein YckC [Isoptericola halotolerans]